ncbi:hypothetical protein [Yaniella flava]
MVKIVYFVAMAGICSDHAGKIFMPMTMLFMVKVKKSSKNSEIRQKVL